MKLLYVAALTFLLLGIAPNAGAVPLKKPQQFTAPGTYLHASGMRFPTAVGSFRRTKLFRFDTEALDVGVNYLLETGRGTVLISVYAYPSPPAAIGGEGSRTQDATRACADELATREAEVTELHADARLLRREVVTPPQPGTLVPGRKTTFELTDDFSTRRQLLHSELYIFCGLGERWMLEYRISYPRSFTGGAAAASSFLRGLRWTFTAGR